MTLLEILRFEAAYQLRRPWLWLFLTAFLAIAGLLLTTVLVVDARGDGFLYNAPTTIAAIMPVVGFFALVVTAALAGDSATRDAATRMDALLYAAPIGRVQYIAGRFLGAFLLNALVLALVPLIHFGVTLWLRMEPAMLGPFSLRGYVDAWLVFGLPNAFIGTALVFAAAALARRPMAAWGMAAALFFASLFSVQFIGGELGRWQLARYLDPSGYSPLRQALDSMSLTQRNTVLLPLGGDQLVNRLFWVGIAALVLGVVLLRFRFEHHVARGTWLGRLRARATEQDREAKEDRTADRDDPGGSAVAAAALVVPALTRSFGVATRLRQTIEVARRSFLGIVGSRAFLALVVSCTLVVLVADEFLEHLGTPLVPRTLRILEMLQETEVLLPTMVITLLILYFAGELMWKDRDTRTAALVDATPIQQGTMILGRFLGFALALVAMQALVLVAGVILQSRLGYHEHQLGLYASVLFGVQLVDYLLWAALAMSLHAVAGHKYVGHLLVILFLAFTAFSGAIRIEHNLLIFAGGPSWRYSDMGGFGSSLAPFLWFRLWWIGWVLLLGVAMRLLMVRGVEEPMRRKLTLARRRFVGGTAWTAAFALGVVLAAGGFTFYNTNILNDHHTAQERIERRVEYERRYGRFADAPQPLLSATTLRVELYPSSGSADVAGAYVLSNRTGEPIDSIHLATASEVETSAVAFDRAATLALDDADLHHRIYVLDEPLLPDDSLRLDFQVRYRRRGFRNDGVDPAVEASAVYVQQHAWLPAVGYQRARELAGEGLRRQHGLPPRPDPAYLEDEAARHDYADLEPIRLDVTIGTEPEQVAATAGTLQETWTENGRRYFRYVTDAPIPSHYAFFSAAYEVRESSHDDVGIRILYHPEHAAIVDRIEHAARASLESYAEAFGPYPHRQLRIVEYPSQGIGASAPPTTIAYTEGYALLDPARDHRELDFPFAVMAHEIAHQWWGDQLLPARVEGAALLSESLAWYSAMGVVEQTYGREHLRRLLAVMRESYLTPRSRAAVALVRASDHFLGYRKGAFAMYALREYVGEERLNGALRRLLVRYADFRPPLATSLDLYAEIRAVTPDSLAWLLDDLLLRNTYWDLAVDSARAEPMASGAWRVVLDVQATKAVVDTAGVETPVAMDDVVEIGVFPAATADGTPVAPLYLARHRIRSGAQRIVVTVGAEPARAGIDPYHLLLDTAMEDNTVDVTLPAAGRPQRR